MYSLEFEFNNKQYTVTRSPTYISKEYKTIPLLYIAENFSDLECDEAVLDEYISKNKEHINTLNSNSHTPLMLACLTNNITVVKLLLKHGANVDEIGVSKSTALLILISENKVNENIIRILLKAGSDVNALDIYERTSLLILCESKKEINENIFKILLEAGAYVNISYNNGITPLIAICNNHVNSHKENIIKLLLEAGAYVNVDCNSMTPLMIVSANPYSQNNANIVKLLLEKGAYVNVRNKYRRTALMLANIADIEYFEEILNIFISYRANLNIKNTKGETLLYRFCVDSYQRYNNIIKILLDNGANPNIKTNYDRTVLADLLLLIPNIELDIGDNLLSKEEVEIKNEIKLKKWYENRSDLVKMLLNFHIDLNIKINDKTQFEYICACDNLDEEIVKYCFTKHNYYTLEIIQNCTKYGKYEKYLTSLAHKLLYDKIGYYPLLIN